MKTYYSAQDIESLAGQGRHELVVDEDTVLTDLARDAAARLGVRLVAPGRAPAAPAAANPATPTAALPPIPAKPRGCLHASGASRTQLAAPATNGRVVDDLVGAIKQLSKG